MDSDSYYSPSPEEKFSRRLSRSLENPLHLLHRNNSDFFILGATGNVYTVTLSTTPTCTCPDATTPCKHILFLYVRVLNLPTNDPCLRLQTLPESDLTRLLSTHVSDEAFAGEGLRERFLELYDERKKNEEHVKVEEGCKCTVCLEEMGVDERKVVKCRACKNPIHEECVMSRAKWTEIGEEGKYINLKKYLSDDDDDDDYGYGYGWRKRRKRRGYYW
ncbi:putative transferase [Helianthus annuus]|uniref:Putative zinc finger, SWIM-type, Zinc finger, RING/FYVE/PHD-type n=1 Tax=Helianthus annuus TaxID=4232 RepID=A0A251SSA5_HELAN|nr:mitogen-activated protein kinase kinase kinase 1 [Helianthus annuus]KAF5773320.1 putative transferase [Helianthus annuus]KAJ0476828.1 putative transferase [Helianthus annuus]KAJ0497652.1 putative transferase [Helianthus annuus]KAJ0663657.1 putative transferase [Helianthus annuus]KAJ0671155.1 putative transferase [Helianthus annuus]